MTYLANLFAILLPIVRNSEPATWIGAPQDQPYPHLSILSRGLGRTRVLGSESIINCNDSIISGDSNRGTQPHGPIAWGMTSCLAITYPHATTCRRVDVPLLGFGSSKFRSFWGLSEILLPVAVHTLSLQTVPEKDQINSRKLIKRARKP